MMRLQKLSQNLSKQALGVRAITTSFTAGKSPSSSVHPRLSSIAAFPSEPYTGRDMLPFLARDDNSMAKLNNMFSSLLPSMDSIHKMRTSELIHVDFYENDSGYHMDADCPGINKSDIKLTVNAPERLLCLETTKTIPEDHPANAEGKGALKYHRLERFIGGYVKRILRMPDDAKLDELSAKFDNGVLHVDLPRMEPLPDKSKVVEIA